MSRRKRHARRWPTNPNDMPLHSDLIPALEKGSRRLLIMLHGLGDSVQGYRWLPDALNLPWLNYLLVNAPDEYYGGYSWYDFVGDISPIDGISTV